MNTSYAMNTYMTHDLNIAMRTSSGDTIEMDFSNQQSSSLNHKENQNGSSASMTFSSMQSFEFKIDTNGIDAQDQKEIDEFMKIAQPFIDDFLKELKDSAPKTPVTQLAHKIASIFEPDRDRGENAKNHLKTNIVNMFDNSMKKLDIEQNIFDDIFKDTQKLLEQTLKEFEKFNKTIYA